MDVKTWIIKWFEENTDLEISEIENQVEANFLEQGWIDSFKFITFIADLEDKFEIHFSNDQFQDRAFSTINGLSKIIEGKIHE